MFLIADIESMAPALDTNRDINVRFLKTADLSLVGSDSPDVPEYRGHLKVLTASVIVEFYHALKLFGHPSELPSFTDPIWKDPLH